MSLVSVVIPVYRPNIEYFKLAIKSILFQSHRELEIIIIEDSPQGIVEETLKKFNDNRIVYIGNKSKLGIAGSINKGMSICNGKYIARMDDDDFSLKNRIKIQHDFMEKNPLVGVCGAWCIRSDNYEIMVHELLDYEKRRVKLLFENEGLFHPTVIFRKSFMEKNKLRYDESLVCAEDYDMWEKCCRISDINTICKPLLLYRIHENQASNNTKQNLYIDNIRKKQLNRFKSLTESEKDIFIEFKCPSKKLRRVIKKMVIENRNNRYYSKVYFEGTIGCKWLEESTKKYKITTSKILYGCFFNPINKIYIFANIIIALQNRFKTKIIKHINLKSKGYKNSVSLAKKIGM